jgi:plastocyanin
MRTALPALLAVLALAVAGCGGGDKNAGSSSSGGSSSSSGGGGGEQLALTAPKDGSLKFDKTTLTAKAGKVTIDFDNASSSVPHGIGIKGNGVDEDSDTVTGAKTSVTATLKPGKYTFYCPVPGHEQSGMKGTLTVQ